MNQVAHTRQTIEERLARVESKLRSAEESNKQVDSKLDDLNSLVKNPIHAGDIAWMMTSTALVLMMTIPGLALFYGGMVRVTNVLSTLMQCFTIVCLITIEWMALGNPLSAALPPPPPSRLPPISPSPASRVTRSLSIPFLV